LVMLSGMELDVAPDLLHRRQPAADAACCRARAGESTAAQTKPARAGVRCRASAEPHLTANAGRCECYSRARMRTAGSALAVAGASDAACCASGARRAECSAFSLLSCRAERAQSEQRADFFCPRGQVSLFCLDLRFYQFNNGASRSLIIYSVHNTLVY